MSCGSGLEAGKASWQEGPQQRQPHQAPVGKRLGPQGVVSSFSMERTLSRNEIHSRWGGGKEMPRRPHSAPSLLSCSWSSSRPRHPSPGYIRGAALRKNWQQLPVNHPARRGDSESGGAVVAQLRREVRGSGRAGIVHRPLLPAVDLGHSHAAQLGAP